jgi:hypothetical protein
VIVATPNIIVLNEVPEIERLMVEIKSEDGDVVLPKISRLQSDSCEIEWTPFNMGTYKIDIYYGNHQIQGAPFEVKTFDPNMVRVYDIKDGYVMKKSSFCVDASNAGKGNLEIGVSCNDNYVPNQVKLLGNSKFEIQFTPEETKNHFVSVTFNNVPIKGL